MKIDEIRSQAGFTLVEMVVAIALIVSLSVGMAAVNNLMARSLVSNQNETIAGDLLKEGMEAVQVVRANDFQSLNAGIHHPVYDGSNWSIASGEEVTADGFRRRIILSPVQRTFGCGENVCDIVEEGGVIDEFSLEVLVEVEWDEAGQTRLVDLSGFITYWR